LVGEYTASIQVRKWSNISADSDSWHVNTADH